MAEKKAAQKSVETEEKVRNRLNSEAVRTLKERHNDEFEDIITALYEAEGLTRRRRLTAEERAERDRLRAEAKAQEDLEKLLQRHPSLASKIKD